MFPQKEHRRFLYPKLFLKSLKFFSKHRNIFNFSLCNVYGWKEKYFNREETKLNETRQSTEKRFSEAASENKKKRGRPTVYKRDHMEGMGRDLEIFDGRTHRTHVNQYYRAAVFGILEEHKEIPYLEEIFKIGQCLCIQKDEIIEQLGRMYAQDGYSEETIVEAATLAARFYHNGNTVKEIAAYLRRVRKAKSWDV